MVPFCFKETVIIVKLVKVAASLTVGWQSENWSFELSNSMDQIYS
jgi:hypothetical protein